MSADPTAEHIDAVARIVHRFVESHDRDEMVAELLTSTDPEVHAALAASLPAEVMLAALVDRGTLTKVYQWAADPTGGTERTCLATPWEVAP